MISQEFWEIMKGNRPEKIGFMGWCCVAYIVALFGVIIGLIIWNLYKEVLQ